LNHVNKLPFTLVIDWQMDTSNTAIGLKKGSQGLLCGKCRHVLDQDFLLGGGGGCAILILGDEGGRVDVAVEATKEGGHEDR
jgi:hypothetical protein